MSDASRYQQMRVLKRRSVLAAIAGVAGVSASRSATAREGCNGRPAQPLVSARASDILIDLVALGTRDGVPEVALRFTNIGATTVGIGPGLIRARLADRSEVAVGDRADVCALDPGASSRVVVAIAADRAAPLDSLEIGLLEANRAGAMVQLTLSPLRANARGGDSLSSVRSDSRPGDGLSPDTLAACVD